MSNIYGHKMGCVAQGIVRRVDRTRHFRKHLCNSPWNLFYWGKCYFSVLITNQPNLNQNGPVLVPQQDPLVGLRGVRRVTLRTPCAPCAHPAHHPAHSFHPAHTLRNLRVPYATFPILTQLYTFI